MFWKVSSKKESRWGQRSQSSQCMAEDIGLWREMLGEGNKRRVMSTLKKRESQFDEWPTKEGIRDAAVLVPMVIVDGQPSVLFTVRSQYVSRHRQQVR